MKKLFTIIVLMAIGILLTVNVFAQSPEKMSYQAVIRNSSNALVINTSVSMKISILQGSVSGTAVYTETQKPTTNANGLVSVEIGTGTTSDSFSAIDWANGPYFIKTETDLVGSTNYTITGTSQLLSVPYALYAKTSDKARGISGNLSINTDINWAPLNVGGIGQILPGNNTWGVQLALNSMSLPGGKYYSLNSLAGDAGEGQGKFLIANNKGPALTIDSLKNIGIGTYNPVSKLDVVGEINVNNNHIKNLADPVNMQDAATKAYVDVLLTRIKALELSDILNNGFTDTRDGNFYNAVKIGNQVWMAENLRYLPSVVGPFTSSVTTPYYYVFDYDGASVTAAKNLSNYTTYGVLYNWPAAMAGSASSAGNQSGLQGVCPAGWHLPSDAEWTQLTTYHSGESVAGGKLKETGTTHWISPNIGATNETGFKALPGGYRSIYNDFYNVGYYGYWWCATENSASYAWVRYMYYNSSNVLRNNDSKEVGFSVRCVSN